MECYSLVLVALECARDLAEINMGFLGTTRIYMRHFNFSLVGVRMGVLNLDSKLALNQKLRSLNLKSQPSSHGWMDSDSDPDQEHIYLIESTYNEYNVPLYRFTLSVCGWLKVTLAKLIFYRRKYFRFITKK